jgi:hypothetical protein
MVDSLCLNESAAWAHTVLQLEGQLRQDRQAVVDALHDAVRRYADQPVQRLLISLKRDVFNLRTPKNKEATATVLALPELCDTGLGAWLEQLGRRDELLADGQKLFEAEIARRRESFKEAISEPSFRKGLLAASPSLESDIDHYLKAPAKKLNRRLRLVERAALLYLLRTACKTSPFSTLGVVAEGVVGDDVPRSQLSTSYRVADMEKRSFVRLNVATLSRLSTLLLTCEEVRRDLPLRLKEDWEIHDDRIRYLRRTVSINESAGPQTMDTVKESIFYLPLSPTLRRLLEFLGRHGEGKLSDIAHNLANMDEDADDVLKIEEFLIHLLRLDLLVVPALRLPLYSHDFLAEYAERLATLDSEKAQAAAVILRRVETLVNDYAAAPVEARRTIQKQIGQEVADCYQLFGAPVEHVPNTLLYEDATLSLPQLGINAEQWDDRLASLSQVQDLLPIFDMTVQPRLVMNAFFKIIYGQGQQCADVLSFAEVFTQDYYDQYKRAAMRRAQTDADGNLQPSINHFNIPEVNILDELRQEFADYLGAELAKTPAGSPEMELSKEALSRIAARVPANVSRLYSHSFFSQVAETEDGPRLVINRIYSGLTQMFSRFINPLENGGNDGLDVKLRESLEQLQPPGVVFAELQGGYDTNLNLHPTVTRYEIVCPGDRSSRPVEEQIPISDLYIEHDPASDMLRLRSQRLGLEIIPLYLGFLLPGALPQLRQILINFSCPSFSTPYLWVGVQGGPKVGDTIAFYPRIRFDEIILQRGIWKMSPDYLPKRAPMQSDADYFLALSRWREENGIPRRVFVTPDSYSPRGAKDKAAPPPKEDEAAPDATPEKEIAETGATPEKAESKAEDTRHKEADQMIRKPMYVDFENFFSLMLLERVITKSSARVVMTEMLPSQKQLWFKHDGGSYVTEFILEMSKQRGGTHE